MIRLALLVLALSPIQALGDARTPTVVLPASTGGTPALATEGDVTAALIGTASSTNLMLRISDGQGVTWGPLTPVDSLSTADFITMRKPAIVGDNVYTLWADDRNYQAPLWPLVATTLFVREFDSKTGIGGPEIEVPTGIAPAHVSSSGYDFVALDVGGATHLHIASLQRELDPVTGLIQQQVVLYSSHDGGTTWQVPLAITPAGSTSYKDVRVLADGNQVHVLYTDNTFFAKPQLYDQRSLDGGLTTDFVVPTAVPGANQAWNFDADLDASLLAIVFESFEADFAFSSAVFVSSRDGGITYENSGGFGAAGVFVDQSYDPRVSISEGTQAVSAVAGGFDLMGNAFVLGLHTADGGQSFGPGNLIVQGAVQQADVATSGPGRDRVAVTWAETVGGTSIIRAATSFDRGATFEAPFDLTQVATGYHMLAFNALHQNVLVSFGTLSGVKPQFVGGYRPQSITVSGLAAGSTSIAASFEHFDGGADLAWLLLSTDTASQPLPLGDGRELGIGLTPLYSSLLPLALGGLMAAPLAADGSGTMAPLPIAAPGIPPGLQVFAVGLSFDFATASFVDISDVVALGT